jgi:hypothetical protein
VKKNIDRFAFYKGARLDILPATAAVVEFLGEK